MLKTISLFTGAGGLDLGLHAAGFSTAAAVELDQASITTLEEKGNGHWWSNTAVIHSPIEDVTSDILLEQSKLKREEASLLVGGPPCQPFSKSGYWHSGDSLRLKDPRANTLSEFLRVLEDTLPEVFLLENVPGLAYSNKDEGLELLRRELAQINKRRKTRYKLFAKQLNAVDYGVPQTRERVFVVGHRDGKLFEFPAPTNRRPSKVDMSSGCVTPHESALDETLLPCATAWDALADVVFSNADEAELAVRGKWAELLPSIPEGSNYLFHTGRGRGKAIFGWRTRYWSMLLKLAKSRPSWTLTAQPGPAIGPFHWDNRRLSAAEMCALQTFPSEYSVVGSLALAQRQIGNAVPSALAEIMGLEIRRQLFGDSVSGASATLLPRSRSDTPAPKARKPVPSWCLSLVGKHADHPGTGRGPGAKRQASRGKSVVARS